MEEIWKDIKGYEGLYQVSNFGRIKSVDRYIEHLNCHGHLSKFLKKGKEISKCKNGKYQIVTLYKNGTGEKICVHRLVAIAFVSNPKKYFYVNHKDANPLNNNSENLEWCTQSYNIKYAYDNYTKIAPHKRPIKQYSIDNKLIDVYDSINEASRITKIHASNIYKCCKGVRNHAGGYKWKYLEQK